MINLAMLLLVGCLKTTIPAHATVASKAGFSWSCQHDGHWNWAWIKIRSQDCEMTSASAFIYKLNGHRPHYHLHKKENCDWEIRLLLKSTSCNDIKSISLVQTYKEKK